jgi:hypothetical protein
LSEITPQAHLVAQMLKGMVRAMPNNRNHVGGHGIIEYAGVPPANYGHKDQYCRNTLTGEMYQKKTASTWELTGDWTNSNVLFGVNAPASNIGRKGDCFIDYVHLVMHEKSSDTVWSPRCKLLSL